MKLLDLVEKYQSTAPVDVEGLIRAVGVHLDKEASLHPEISGQIGLNKNGTYEIAVNKNDFYYRSRFTMAHELGHYILHRDLLADGTDDTKAYRSTPDGEFYNRNIKPFHETEANQFAANLLMPPSLVRREWVACGDDVAAMAKKFAVSKEAMNYRLKNLGLLK